MKWWQIRKRDADLDRELRSDLELEEEEQRENGHLGARPVDAGIGFAGAHSSCTCGVCAPGTKGGEDRSDASVADGIERLLSHYAKRASVDA